jgi:hypothetical protein
MSDEKPIIFRLRKITNFDDQEILLIQSEFKNYCQDAHKLLLANQKHTKSAETVQS